MVSASGASSVMAIIEELTPKTCRLRSINVFKIGESVSFDFTLRGAQMLQLSGVVASTALNGTRRSYTIALQDIDEDRIVAALDAAQRFAIAHPVRDVHTGNGLTRASARIPVQMDVEYRILGGPLKLGHATNVSSGGILLNSEDQIIVGSAVELKFTLPGTTRPLTVHGRVVAHQHESPNYNMAFYSVGADTRAELEAFVASHTKDA